MSKNTLASASDRFWYSKRIGLGGQDRLADERYFGDWTPADIHELCNEAFSAGARWSLAETTRLSPHIAQFIEMLILLGVYDGLVETAQDAPGNTSASSATTGGCSQSDDDELRDVRQAV